MFTDRPYDGFSVVSTDQKCTLQVSVLLQQVFSPAVSQYGPYLRSARFDIKYLLRVYLKDLSKSRVYIRQPKDTFTPFSWGEGGGMQGWKSSSRVVATPYYSFPSCYFSPDSKESLVRLLYFCNVLNEVQAFSYIIFEKLKFFFSGIFFP